MSQIPTFFYDPVTGIRGVLTDVDPSVTGLAAPIGSMAVYVTSGLLFLKTGAADTDWVDQAAGGGGGGAPTTVDYLVKTASGSLSAERVVTDTTTVTWDWATAGQAKANIPNDAVTYAKLQNVSATDKLLGRSTAGAGDVEEIACTAAGRALIDDADATAQRSTLGLGAMATKASVATGDIDNDAVSYAKMQNVSATDKLLGRSTAGSGDVEEITCTAAGRALLDDANAAAQLATLGAEASANKDAASGYCGLDANSKIAVARLPSVRAVTTANQAAIGTTATTITGLTLALAASKKYFFAGKLFFTVASATNTMAGRVKYSGTLLSVASGQSIFTLLGLNGAPDAFAASMLLKRITRAVNAAIASATNGPGNAGSTTKQCEVTFEGVICTSTSGNLDLEAVCSAAAGLVPLAGSYFEAFEIG